LKLKKGNIIKLNIESLSFGGSGFAKYEGAAVFVEKGLPGQEVEAFIFKKQKTYFKAKINNIIKESPHSINPKCSHFNDCGGCSFQNFDYSEQTKEKYQQVKDTLEHIGNFKDLKINPITKAKEQFNYRNKMEFTFSNNPWFEKYNPKEKKDFCIGLHPKGRFDKIIDIQSCEIQSHIANQIINTVRDIAIELKIIPYDIKKHVGFLRQLVIRSADYNNETMVIIVTSKKDHDKLSPIIKELSKIKEIKSIINNVNSRKADVSYSEEQYILYGEDSITEKLGTYKFKISPDSFFQTNSKQAKKLYDIIKDEADLKGDEIVYDLYCGTGTIGIYLSDKAKKIFGFEIIHSAIDDAIINASNNNVKNALFFQGDIKDSLVNNKEMDIIEKPDISIIDPPRSGLHPKALKNIVDLDQKKIIYISCNPATQARDLKEIVGYGYKIKKIRPLDMFPHTPHIETVVTLVNERY
tara:strand:- start:619 stop:2019 length:1401 start_codon:yes stop_codon:yes gene_type:complete